MIFPSNRVPIQVSTTPVDFRKGHDGLAAMVQSVLRKDPFMGTVFVFRAKRADRLKLLYWDGSGLVFAIGLEHMATQWLTLQAARRHNLHLACNQGRDHGVEPCAVRGSFCGAGLAEVKALEGHPPAAAE